MRRRIVELSALLLLLLPSTAGGQATPVQPDAAHLKPIVTLLASPEMRGRRGLGAAKARAYLVESFQNLGLKPLFDGSFTQSIPGPDPDRIVGENVGVFLEGSDPVLKDQWIVVSAHYDHLGVRRGELFPGADDNASGVAMMLEVARSMVELKEKPRRSVMFLGFDLEEDGLFGSRYFAEHSPVPISKISLFITADMIGRSLGGVCDTDVFVMGSEHAPGVREWLKDASIGQKVDVGLLGSDLLILDRSDYGPFRVRHVPYLFFSTGENPTYHKPTDIAETINYPKLEAISRIVLGVVEKASMADECPPWQSLADNPLEEAITIRKVLIILLANEKELNIGPTRVTIMRNALKSLDRIVSEKVITGEERTWLIRVARLILFSIF